MSALTRPLRMAYADPPYIGQAKRHYSDQSDYAGEVDHKVLIERLMVEYPAGWALSASSPSLKTLLPWCPDEIRIGAWVKSFCAFKRGVRPAYAWEPVLFHAGRNPGYGTPHPPPLRNGKQTTPKDFIVCPITLKKGLVGVKPERVCFWIFGLLNLQPGDRLDDLYPGSGAVTQAWHKYQSVSPLMVA